MTLEATIERVRTAQEAIRTRPPQAVIDPLIGLCQRLRNPGDPLRAEAIRVLRECTGLSDAVITWGLDTSFGAWIGTTGDEASAIRTMLTAELVRPAGLGAWVPTARPGEEERWVPYPLTVQILAGNVFAATVHQLLAGLLARTGQLVKPAHGQVPFVELLLRGLRDIDAELADSIACLPFESSDRTTRDALLRAADVVIVTGSDATVEALTPPAPLSLADSRKGGAGAKVIHGFGHRVSAVYIARFQWEQAERLHAIAEALALDVSAYDQAGCLSPMVVFVEDVLPTDLLGIATIIFDALRQRTNDWPIGTRDAATRTARRAWLDNAAMRPLSAGLERAIWADEEIAVVIDTASPIQPGPGMRTLILAPVGHPQGVLERLRPWQAQLGTLGVALHPAVSLKGFRQSSGLFGRGPSGEPTGAGFNRICDIGMMQQPRIDEPHDGRPRLRLFLTRETRQI